MAFKLFLKWLLRLFRWGSTVLDPLVGGEETLYPPAAGGPIGAETARTHQSTTPSAGSDYVSRAQAAGQAWLNGQETRSATTTPAWMYDLAAEVAELRVEVRQLKEQLRHSISPQTGS